MAFNPEIGERAMLIRNCHGDWGLCIGRWAKGKHTWIQSGDSGVQIPPGKSQVARAKWAKFGYHVNSDPHLQTV